MIQLPFLDREEAAHALAGALRKYAGTHPVILAIPRGAVPMGRILADALEGDLDMLLVRKIGAPGDPEYAIGAVDERGAVILNDDATSAGASQDYLDREAQTQLALIRAWRRLYAPRGPVELRGRTVIVLDDGLATGATMEAALRAARAQHPALLVCAVPVAAPDRLARVERLADAVVCLATPTPFRAVGLYYRNFRAVQDEDMAAALKTFPQARTEGHSSVRLRAGTVELEGDLGLPSAPQGLVILAHDGASGQYCERNRFLAHALNDRGLATLLVDLLTLQEDAARSPRFDIDLMVHRLEAAVAWASLDSRVRDLPIGLFGANTGAAAALCVAAAGPPSIAAVVARGGRPDLAGASTLRQVRVPVLLIVGSADGQVLELNRAAAELMGPSASLQVVPGAGHLFVEPGAMGQLASMATAFFAAQLKAPAAVAG